MTDVKKWEPRMAKVIVLPVGSSLNHEQATEIFLDDEGDGEFVAVTQDDQTVRFERDEWPVVRAAIDRMVTEIRDKETEE